MGAVRGVAIGALAVALIWVAIPADAQGTKRKPRPRPTPLTDQPIGGVFVITASAPKVVPMTVPETEQDEQWRKARNRWLKDREGAVAPAHALPQLAGGR